MRRPLLALLLGALLVPATAAAEGVRPSPPPVPASPLEPPRPFDRGSLDLGLIVAFSTGSEVAFTLGGTFGYFVLPGLEPGLQVDVTFGSNRKTVTSLLPYLRWVFYRSYFLSPYVKLQGGRFFIDGADDLSGIGGGGGLVFFLTRVAGIQLEGMVYRLFPSEACPENGCTATSFGLTVGFYFGGGGRRTPPRPPPRPPPTPSPPSASQPSEGPPRDEPGGPG